MRVSCPDGAQFTVSASKTGLFNVLLLQLYRIRASLEDNVVKVRKVLKDLKTDREVDINALVHEIYDHNKELLQTERRRDLRNSLALTEVGTDGQLTNMRHCMLE